MDLPVITDDTMKAALPQTRTYTLMIVRKTSKHARPAADAIV